jgi:hypothetical protein
VLRDLLSRSRRVAWRLAKVGMLTATALVFCGGLLAGPARHLSDVIVLAAFGVLIPSVALAWIGLPTADASTPISTLSAQERIS